MHEQLIEEARRVHLAHFGTKTWFERAVFLSWHCSTASCRFCYMHLIQDRIPEPEKARRRWESVLAEVLLCRELKWRIGFLSAGTDAYNHDELASLAGMAHRLYGRKIPLNVGPLSREQLEEMREDVSGVSAAVETVNWKLREEICPEKPLGPYLDMLASARKLGMKRIMTLIIGLGESHEDYAELKDFIKKHKIDKLVIYGIVPHEGSPFTEAPSAEELAWWIAKTRIDHPDLEITAGIWHDRVDQLGLLLRAGANAFTKFRAVKYFGSEQARNIHKRTHAAHRNLDSWLYGEHALDRAEELLSEEEPLMATHGIKENLLRSKLSKYVTKMKNG